MGPGIFALCCRLGGLRQALDNLREHPDYMHDLIRYLTDFELRLADEICAHVHPDALFHRDGWGARLADGLSPAMFDDFFLEPYKEVYQFYRSRGVELIVHHDGGCAAALED